MKKRNDFKSAQTLPAAIVIVLAAACGPAPSTAPRGPHAGAHGHPHGGKHRAHHHRFDDAEGWSKVFDDPARDAWQKPARVVELLGVAPGMTVAEVGAGTGYFAPYLSRAAGPSGKVILEDIEPTLVKWMTDRSRRDGLTNVEVVLGTAADPKLPERAVDRVLVVDVWHHVEHRPELARKLAAALRPGGLVLVVDFTAESPEGPPKEARLAPEEVVGDLAAAGLEAGVIGDAGLPNQYVVRGRAAVNR